MKRRDGLLALCGCAVAPAASAQRPGRHWRIGYIGFTANDSSPRDARIWTAFVERLRERGFVEGSNLTIEQRFVEGHAPRNAVFADELVRLGVDLVVASSGAAARAVLAASSSLPVVVVSVGEPVRAGLVKSLAHPGGQVTGLASLADELVPKRIELLKAAVPGIRRIGFARCLSCRRATGRSAAEIEADTAPTPLKWVCGRAADGVCFFGRRRRRRRPGNQWQLRTIAMRLRTTTTLLACAVAGLVLTPAFVRAEKNHDHQSQSSTNATFGRGLNTARPGNAVNHVILPTEIKVKAGGVVDFGVAGFHSIVIFKPGFTLADLVQVGGGQLPLTPPIFVIPPDPNAALPVNLALLVDHIYYRGINPAGGPLGTVVAGNPANGSNRSEPVAFFDKGVYLVICNIRSHLADGMFAYVKVN